MKNDYGTQSYCQWFYFRIQNTRAGATYRFHLTNMMKPTSTYNNGMRPLTYSVIDSEKIKTGWKRDGENIAYYLTSKPKKAFKN